MGGVQFSSVAGRDRKESMTVWEKSPIYGDDDGDRQVENETTELALEPFYGSGYENTVHVLQETIQMLCESFFYWSSNTVLAIVYFLISTLNKINVTNKNV